MKILDVGCGPRKTKGSIGLDANPQLNPDIIWDMNKIPFPINDNSFDKIICSHVIEHLKVDLYSIMMEFWRILKPSGVIIIRTPHFSHISAWASYDHIRPFASNSWDFLCEEGISKGERFSDNMFITEPKFKIIEKKLVYETALNNKFLKVISAFIEFISNLNPLIAERLWVYWIGGFSEIYIELSALK